MRYLLVLLVACAAPKTPNPPTDSADVTTPDLASLTHTKVLFHHHSIGENIMGEWTDDGKPGGATTLGISFAAATTPDGLNGPTEISGGNNGRPKEKLASLKNILIDQGYGAAAEAVVFKLCYLDFGGGSDTTEPALEAAYKATMQEITAAYPNLPIIHLTPPLNSYWNSAGNDQRAAFAAFLKREYTHVFDLEAVVSDGGRCNKDGVPVTCDEFIGKSGHLSGAGATAAAKGLLSTILQSQKR